MSVRSGIGTKLQISDVVYLASIRGKADPEQTMFNKHVL